MAPPKIRILLTSLALVGAATITAGAAAPAQSAAATLPIAVSISKTRAITMPAALQPGVNEFHVMTAAKRSAFQLAKPAAGYTINEAVRDINKGLEQGNIKQLKRFEANTMLYGGVEATPVGMGTLHVTLPAGTYWAVDVDGKIKAAKFFTFTVGGLDTGNAMPASSTIKAKGSATWAKSPASIPNKGTLTFKNRADQNHFLIMTKLKKGKDLEDFEEWFLGKGPPAGPPPVDFNVGLETGVISPGLSMTFDYKLPQGNYVMLCFWPDASMDGMPHALMGMYRQITLN